MKYLVLLYDDESDATTPGTPEFDAELAAYGAFGELAGDAVLGGAALYGTDSARTIRHGRGTVTVTDGPFAETAEALGGVYYLEADNLDDVIELVRHIPATRKAKGAAEIRPMAADILPNDVVQQDHHLVTMHGTFDDSSVPGTAAYETRAAEVGAFADAAGAVFIGGGSLQPSDSATTVRVRDGEVVVSDGPFSETIEVVGGFVLLKGTAAEVEAAAAKIPVPPDGGAVEIRPIVDLSAM